MDLLLGSIGGKKQNWKGWDGMGGSIPAWVKSQRIAALPLSPSLPPLLLASREREGRCVQLGGSRCLPIFWHLKKKSLRSLCPSEKLRAERQSCDTGDSQKKEQVTGTDFS